MNEIDEVIQKNTDELYDEIWSTLKGELNNPTDLTQNGVIGLSLLFYNPSLLIEKDDTTNYMIENNDRKHDDDDMLYYAQSEEVFFPVKYRQLKSRLNDNNCNLVARHAVLLKPVKGGFIPEGRLSVRVNRHDLEYYVSSLGK